MKKLMIALAACAAVLVGYAETPASGSINEQAAALQPGEWLVTPMTGNASDIVTNGTLVLTTSNHGDMLADSPYGITGDESVAGLSFHAFSDMFDNTTTQLKNGNFNGRIDSYGNCGHTDDAYGHLLSEGWYGNSPVVAEFTYIGLQAGQTYLVQGFIHDGRDGTKGNKAKIGGVDLQYGDVEGGTWYYGGTFVHVFVPTGSTYKFSIDYSQGAVQMNAVQLRKVTRGADPFAGKTVRERAAKLRPGEWLAMPMQGAATDIVTEGEINSYKYNMKTYEMAYAKGTYSGDDTVGGVKFRDDKTRLAINPSIGKNADGLGNCGMTGDYATMLSKAWNADTSSSGHNFTYSELEIGQTYLVQIVLHSGKTAANWQQSDGYAVTAVITDGDGTAHVVECGAVNADDRWYYGGTFLHVFTATETTYSFNVKFYKNDVETAGGLLNAIQLRKVERHNETIAELAAELESGEWMAAPLTGDPSDILTMGDPVTYTNGNDVYTNAYAAGANSMTEAGHASVGGIAFANGFYKNLSVGGNAWGGEHGDCGLSGDYAKLLDSLYFKDDVHELTFTIGSESYPALEVGADYVIQLFFHSAYAGGGQDWTQDTVTVDTDKTVKFGAANAGDDWYYGGTLVHRFTAESTSYSFTLNYSGPAIYNAFQIRKVAAAPAPAVPVYTLTIPPKTGIESVLVTTNGTEVTGVNNAYSIVSNTEVTVTFTAASGYEITGINPVTLTIEADKTFGDSDYPAVEEQDDRVLVWSTGTYTPSAWTPADANLLRGITAALSDGFEKYVESSTSQNPATLTDGEVPPGEGKDNCDYTKIFPIKKGVLTWTLEVPSNIRSFSVYSRWGDNGRSAIRLSELAVRYAMDGEWKVLGTDLSNTTEQDALYGVLAESNGGFIAEKVVQIRVTFNSGSQENNGVGYVEFEAQGVGKPVIGSAEVSISGTTATISISDVDLSGAASYDVYCAYGLHGATLSAPTKVVTGATATSTSFELTGLSLGGVYDYEVYAISSSDKQSDTFAGAFHINDPASAVQAVGAKEIIDGDDIVYVWTDATQAGTLSLANDVTADYLLVGGGGAGGFCRGGGGGGGGVLSGTEQELSYGTYTITVGAGGTPDAFAESGACYQQGRTTEGASGKSSLLSSETAVIAEAFGGGGGGNFDSGNNVTINAGLGYEEGVRNVATGGGSAGKSTVSAAGYTGMGFAGGAANGGGGDWAAGGGGGAGEVGKAPSAENHAGDGGAGVTSTITGVAVCYGGGGGGGVYCEDADGKRDRPAGVGGEGGGGHGGNGANKANTGMTAGVDGLGGGGGGASGHGNRMSECGGAAGGSGTVIIRIPLTALTEPIVPKAVAPTFATPTAEVDGASATITLSHVSIGTDETGETAATSYSVYAYTGTGPATDPVVTGEDDATVSFMLTDLAPGAHTYSVYIVNNEGLSSMTNTVTFAIEDTRPLEERVADMRGGDWIGMPLTGEPADVLTNGTMITIKDNNGNPYQFSYGRTDNGNAYTTDETVNNVPAIESTVGFGVRDSGSIYWTGFQGEGAGDCGKTGLYGRYMGYYFKCSRANENVTISCAIPAAGTYLVQMFVHYQSDSYLNQYVSVVDEPGVKIPYTAASGTPGYYGGTLVHVFEMAAAGTYEFTLHYDKEVIVNYIQVRDVSAMIPQEPRLPSITAANVLVEGDCAQVTITGVDMGTDEDGYLATSYDVYASVDGATATLVAADQSEATAMFLLSGLSQGEHDVDVYIVNDKGRTSEALPVEVTIVSSPACFFPEGNWEALQLSKEATEIRTFGETVYALACSAGNNGRLYTVNGLKYHDTQHSDVRWGDWQLVNWADFEPALNSDKDSFGGEDVPTISNEDMAFQTVCKRGWLSDNGSRTTTDFTMTLKQLEPGARYVVQLTAHNGSDNYGGKSQTMTAPDGVSTITLGDADATGACRYGGTLIGTFVASNTTHSFRFTYGPDARYYQVNSIQLRKLGAAPAVVPAYPTLGGTSVFIGRGSATLTVSGLNAGVAGGACDIYYALAEEGQAFGEYTRGAVGVTGASCTFAITGVDDEKSYVYSVYAVNPETRLASTKVEGGFTIEHNPGIPETMTVEPLIRPGLVQAKFGAAVLFDSEVQPPLVSNLLSQTDYDGQLDYTYGALMANQNCADQNVKVVNTYTATQWNWDHTNTVFAYEGEIYLQKGQKLVIFGRFDDGEAAVVDGVTLLAQGNSSGYRADPEVRWVVYEPAETGWYPLNAWVWDWANGKNCMIPPSALAYNLSGITSINDQNRSQWKHLEDTDGKGSFLRFKDSTKTLMTLGKPSTNGVDVTINAAFNEVPGAAKFVAYVSTSHDGGLDPLAWDGVIKIADIASGDTAAANYTVKGLASYPFVRFAIEGEGSISIAERCRNFRQMSCAVGFDSAGLSLVVVDPVFAKTNGTFNVVVSDMGAYDILGLDVEVSSDPAFVSTVYQGTINGIMNPGKFPVAINGLVPGTGYYIRVKPTGAGDDAWIVSAPVETKTPGTLRINEIMASNGTILKTKNGGEDLDWIEIYNGTDEEVDLAGWYLYDDPTKAQTKWKTIQGSCVIPVHGYKVVWCDKDYTNWDASEAWSAIGLSTSGETVFLADPDGNIVDTVTFGTQMKEISYGVGKLPGDTETGLVFFNVPTPGGENDEYGYGPMTPAVAFTVPHGYKTEPIDVAITCEEDPTAAIYFTTNGTQPTATNPAATLYTAPIHIESTTILRAGVPQENSVLQVDSSATYIFLDDVLAMGRVEKGEGVPAGFPESESLPSQGNKHVMRYGMIQSVVNGPDRDRILRGFTNTVATLSIVTDPDCLFNADDGIYVNSRKYMLDGADGERPMLLELIDPVNGAAKEFSVPGGLRLRGAGSLAESNPKHSFRFFFRGKYGMAKLEFPLFENEGAEKFSKVDLRCSQNYSWSMSNSDYETFVHEVFSRDSQRDMGQLYTRSRYYNLFLNGQYWGLYQTQERGDDDFAETYNGGSAGQYDCIKTSSEDQWHYKTGANSGTMDAWKELQGLAYNGFDGDYIDNYNRVLGLNPDGARNEAYPVLLNPENLMAYVTIAHFVCDSDGPVSVGNGGLNNLYANRCRVDGASDMDGFWFLRHDAEHSMGVKGESEPFGTWTQYGVDNTGIGTHEYNPLDAGWSEHYRGEAPTKDNRSVENFGPYELHAQLSKNPVYKRAFADFFYKHYLKEGGAMTVPVAKARFQARMAEIDDVVVAEAARWSPNENQPKSRETWLNACSNSLDFIDKRTPYLKAAYKNRGWYPQINVPEPDVPAGEVAADTVVTFAVSTDAGEPDTDYEVYITTDGSDPADSATASATITLDTLPVTLNARAKKNGEWSALQTVAYQPAIQENDGYTFYFEGEYTGDQTIAPTGSECVVVFNDATINGNIILPDGVKAYFCPTNGTENSVAGIVGPSANLTLKDFDGLGGKVLLDGADTLISISNLVVKSGVLDIASTGVSATKTPVVNVLGHVKQDGGKINLYLEVHNDLQIYGIYVANKDPKGADDEKMKIIYAEFNGGEFNSVVGGWKSAALYINKGSAEATFNEGSTNNVMLIGPEARFVNASGDLNLKGGEFMVRMADDNLLSITNARVFKSDKEIKIKGGHYDVDVPGPGAEIFSVSKNKDGDDSIITIKDGTFELVADDDCFSADDRIDIQGGLFYAVSLNNDVFDSNGDMLVSGGTIMAYATAAGHEAFDVDPVVQGSEVSTFLPHQLTISGGTIFATGGKNSAWPENTVAGTGVNLYMATGVNADDITEKFASIKGTQAIEGTEDTYDVTTTAKLPAFAKDGNALLVTCPNMAEGAVPTFSAVAPTEGSQDFHELYIWSNLPSNQEFVRMYEIYGSTAEGTPDVDFGDVGEYIVLTNVSDKVVQLAGLNVKSTKYKNDKLDKASSLNITLTEGILLPGESIKLEQADFTGKGWDKITNGTIYFQIINDEGTVVQSGFGAFDNELFPKTDGGGAALRAKRFDNETPLEATQADWKSTAKPTGFLLIVR